MDEYLDDSFEDVDPKSKKSKKRNPKGPYTFEMVYRGKCYSIKIENVTYEKFKVYTESLCDENDDFDEDKTREQLISLEKYLESEGFYLAARKWNMFFK